MGASMIHVVKVQGKKVRDKIQYIVTIPREIAQELEIRKGDRLIARVLEVEINGIKRKVLVYYKP